MLGALVLLGVCGPASASLIGDSVHAALSSPNALVTISGQFASPAVVADPGGPEFSGEFSFSGSTMAVTVDVGDSSFVVRFNQNSGLLGLSDGDFLRVDLTDLDWVGQSGEIIGITATGPTGGVSSFGFGPHSAFVIFNGAGSLGAGLGVDIPFALEVLHVPEPLTLGLMVLALAGLGSRPRRAA